MSQTSREAYVPGDMTRGSPARHIVLFALPMMVGGVFQLMYSMVDTAVLGRFVGAGALASIGATSSTTSCFLFLATGVTNAMSIVVSQLIGAGDRGKVRRATVNALYLTALFGVVLGAAAFFGAEPLMRLLGTPEDIIGGAVTYIRITCGLIFAQIAYNAVASILKAVGDSKTPLYFLILCTVLNVLLDLLFVLAFHMTVDGVAYATVISQMVSAVLCFFYMRRKYAIFRFTKADMAPDKEVIGEYLRYGLPMGLTSCLLSVGMFVITGVINSFGSSAVAAYTVGSKVESIAVLLFNQFAFSFSVYAGQNFGAGERERVYRGVKQAAAIILALSCLAAVIMLAVGPYVGQLFLDSGETGILSVAAVMIRIEAVFYPALGMVWLFNCPAGAGRSERDHPLVGCRAAEQDPHLGAALPGAPGDRHLVRGPHRLGAGVWGLGLLLLQGQVGKAPPAPPPGLSPRPDTLTPPSAAPSPSPAASSAPGDFFPG